MHVLKGKASKPTGMAKEIKTELAPLSYCILQHLFVQSVAHFGKEGVTKYCRLKFRITRQTARNLQRDAVYLILYIMGIIAIFNMNSSFWGLYEL